MRRGGTQSQASDDRPKPRTVSSQSYIQAFSQRSGRQSTQKPTLVREEEAIPGSFKYTCRRQGRRRCGNTARENTRRGWRRRRKTASRTQTGQRDRRTASRTQTGPRDRRTASRTETGQKRVFADNLFADDVSAEGSGAERGERGRRQRRTGQRGRGLRGWAAARSWYPPSLYVSARP